MAAEGWRRVGTWYRTQKIAVITVVTLAAKVIVSFPSSPFSMGYTCLHFSKPD